MLLRCEGTIDIETLFCSTTYETEYFNKCIYCNSDVESDFYEYEGKYVGQPHRCCCDEAKIELNAKLKLYLDMKSLMKNVDERTINEQTRILTIDKINRAYQKDSQCALKAILRD